MERSRETPLLVYNVNFISILPWQEQSADKFP